MSRRDRLAGVQHFIELAISLVGFFGWVYFVTHRVELDAPR